MQTVVSAYFSFGRLPMRTKPPMRSAVSKKLKYIDSLKFASPVFSCMNSPRGSRRIRVAMGGAPPAARVLRTAGRDERSALARRVDGDARQAGAAHGEF